MAAEEEREGPGPMPLFWVGGSRDDLREFPEAVRETMGFALWQAQNGDKHLDAKPLRGFGGAGVLEIVAEGPGSTYRAAYTVKFAGAVYVLHAFQKKSKKGIKTPKHEVDLIHRRLKAAEAHYKTWRATRQGEGATKMKGTKADPVKKSSGNVFADLGLRQPQEALAKAQLARRIGALVGERGLTQARAAAILGLDQPKVSALMRGELRGFSVERLFRCLKALGQEIEIVIRPAGRRAEPYVVSA